MTQLVRVGLSPFTVSWRCDWLCLASEGVIGLVWCLSSNHWPTDLICLMSASRWITRVWFCSFLQYRCVWWTLCTQFKVSSGPNLNISLDLHLERYHSSTLHKSFKQSEILYVLTISGTRSSPSQNTDGFFLIKPSLTQEANRLYLLMDGCKWRQSEGLYLYWPLISFLLWLMKWDLNQLRFTDLHRLHLQGEWFPKCG